MRRYQKGTTEILVPHLFAPATVTQTTSQGGHRKQWTEQQFFEKASSSLSQEEVAILKDLYDWSKSKASRVWFGTGIETGSFTFHYLVNKKTISIFSVYSTGALAINFGWMVTQLPGEMIEYFHRSLTAIPGFEKIPADFNRWPSVRIDNVFLYKSDALGHFKALVENFITRTPVT